MSKFSDTDVQPFAKAAVQWANRHYEGRGARGRLARARVRMIVRDATIARDAAYIPPETLRAYRNLFAVTVYYAEKDSETRRFYSFLWGVLNWHLTGRP